MINKLKFQNLKSELGKNIHDIKQMERLIPDEFTL